MLFDNAMLDKQHFIFFFLFFSKCLLENCILEMEVASFTTGALQHTRTHKHRMNQLYPFYDHLGGKSLSATFWSGCLVRKRLLIQKCNYQ